MTPHPIHRTCLFWFGLPVLLALLWGWLAFPSRASGLSWNHGGTYYCISDCSRMFVVGAVIHGGTMPNPAGLVFRSDGTGLGVRSEETALFPAAWVAEQKEDPWLHFQSHRLAISYWLLLATYLVVWLSLLFWWQRRARSKSAAITSTIPA